MAGRSGRLTAAERRGWRLALGARRVLRLVFLSADRGRSAVHDAASELILSLDESVGYLHRGVHDFSPAGWTFAVWQRWQRFVNDVDETCEPPRSRPATRTRAT